MQKNRWIPILIMLILISLGLFVGVSAIFTKKPTKKMVENKKVIEIEHIAKTEKTYGVIREIDRTNNRLVIYLLASMREQSFYYDLATRIRSVNDVELVIAELPLGSIVELEKKDETGLLKKIEMSKAAWDYKGVKNLNIDEKLMLLKIGKTEYSFDNGITVLNGKDRIELSEIDEHLDILEVRGIDEKVYSITVTRGHGVLDFINCDDFLGGNIEIGYDVFDTVTENMKYTLREGRYKLLIKKGELSVNKVIDLTRNKRLVIDLSEYTKGITRKGSVVLTVKPKEAVVYIDGREQDKRKFSLDYGEYLFKVELEGYLPYERVINIDREKMKIGVELAKEVEGVKKEEEIKEVEDVKETEENVISFKKPEGVAVYFDDELIGEIPIEIPKVVGEHSISLRKDGFVSEDYTVNIEDDKEDALFSFPELSEEN